MAPHPVSNKGNKFIFTVLDHFTKYGFAFPERNHEARTVAKGLVERVFLIHEVPIQLLSDRGAEFKGSIFKKVCELLGVEKLRTTAYKPSTNGALERIHRTMNTMLSKVVDEKQKDWDTRVAFVMTAYKAPVHGATGFTPNRLVFGREMRFPNGLVYVAVEDMNMDGGGYSNFVEQQREHFRANFNNAREMLGLSAERSKTRYDNRVRLCVYRRGDWVYYFCPRNRIGRSPKWQNFYSGPYLNVEMLGAVIVRKQKSPRARAMVVHVDTIKASKGDTPESWLGIDQKERPMDRMGDDILTPLFRDVAQKRKTKIVDDENDTLEEGERRKRPKGMHLNLLDI